ncbi:hypothetical protein P4V47_22345 [Brevibacillus laterosporus]|uniref:hypothetical protein n=1 Tax=Brevibacillus laterosporus TaxID=1465 RepID=UPI002E1D9FAD|nr:hypothetical protein [Brevibacillus laterosporus]
MNNVEISQFPKELQETLYEYFQIKNPNIKIKLLNQKIYSSEDKSLVNIFKEISAFEKIWKKSSINSFNVEKLILNSSKISELDIVEIREPVRNLIQKYIEKKCSINDINQDLIELLSDIFDIDLERVKEAPNNINIQSAKQLGLDKNKSVVRGTSGTSEEYKTFALCHHCYKEQIITGFSTEIITGECYRKEEFYNKFRLSKFLMTELVFYGNEAELFKVREKIIYLFWCIGQNLNKKFRIKIANDTFMSDNPEVVLYQILNKSKLELEVYSKSEDKYISVASINFHGSYFSRKFLMQNNNKTFVQTMCVGFGINRISEILEEIKDEKFYGY